MKSGRRWLTGRRLRFGRESPEGMSPHMSLQTFSKKDGAAIDGAEKAAPQLVRGLNVWHATSIVAGTIIGSGIFLVPAEMMQAVGSAKLVYLAWVVGGLLSFFGALTYAELGAVKPESGGEYVYMRDGYCPLGGFLYAWTWFLISKPGSIA